MSIKVTSQGSIPAISLDYIQYKNLNIAVSMAPPYRTAISGTVINYGKDANGIRYYDASPQGTTHISIPDVDSLVAQLSPADQAKAAAALQKVQEGLGVLFEIEAGSSSGVQFLNFE